MGSYKVCFRRTSQKCSKHCISTSERVQGILNHGELISTLANALIEITAVLADAEVKLTLYATPAIQDATAQLLAHIIRFSHRAIKWYSESKLKHMFHAIIHPAPLYYADLLESISTCAWRIYKLANNAAQAEQRDMHNMLIQLKQSLVEHQSINSSKFMDITQYLQQIQHSQILEIVANSVLPSPEKSLQYYRAMSTRRRSRGMVDQGTQGVCTLQDWGGTRSSKLIVVKGSFRTSHIARDLSVRIISLIQKSGIPAIWVLNLKQKDKALHPTAPDILKLLAYQILQTNSNLRNARLDAIKFQTARVESEWLNILVDLLQGVPEIYMILDVETLDRDLYETPDWISLFLQLFQLLQERSIPVHVKVALVSYHTKILDGSDLPTACVVDLSKTKGQGSSMGQSRNLHIRNRNRALKRDVVPSYASRAYFAA